MPSIRTAEVVQKVVKTSVTTLQLPSGSRLNIGAQQWPLTSALTLNTATVGVGGVDATIAAGSLYTVFAVVSSNVVYLIASLNSSLPAGFTQARAVGGFTTNASSQIDQVGEYPGNLAVAGSVSAGGGVAVEDTSNFIINGGFDFWQRGTSGAAASYTTGVYVAADRWKAASLMQLVGAGGMSIVKDTSTPSSNSGASLKFNLTDARVDVCGVGQYIESQNCLPLIGKTCTISFWVKRISSGLNAYPMTAYVSYLNTKDTPSTTILDGGLTTQISSYVVATSMQSLSTSFVKYSMTFSVPSGAANGILFRICLGNGIGDIASATGDLLSIGEVMLNIGTQPAPFKRAGGTIGHELQLCQRYFEKSYEVTTTPGSAAGGAVQPFYITNLPSATRLTVYTQMYTVEKRAAPQVSDIGLWDGASSGGYGVITAGRVSTAAGIMTPNTLYGSTTKGFNFRVDDSSATTEQKLLFHWAANAEL